MCIYCMCVHILSVCVLLCVHLYMRTSMRFKSYKK